MSTGEPKAIVVNRCRVIPVKPEDQMMLGSTPVQCFDEDFYPDVHVPPDYRPNDVELPKLADVETWEIQEVGDTADHTAFVYRRMPQRFDSNQPIGEPHAPGAATDKSLYDILIDSVIKVDKMGELLGIESYTVGLERNEARALGLPRYIDLCMALAKQIDQKLAELSEAVERLEESL